MSVGASAPGRHAAFLAAGLAATAAQVLLLRELVVDVAGDEAAIGVGLAAWLIGIGAGAALARRWRGGANDMPASVRLAGLGLAALAVLPPAAILLGRVLRGRLLSNAGELPGLGLTLLLGLATLLPCGAAVGWTFTTLASAASRFWRGGEAVARLYVVESLGSLAGGLAVTLLAGRLLPLRLSAFVGLAAALAASASASRAWRRACRCSPARTRRTSTSRWVGKRPCTSTPPDSMPRVSPTHTRRRYRVISSRCSRLVRSGC
jgi:hypothetical protein